MVSSHFVYFPLRLSVSGKLQTPKNNKTVLLALQQGNSCCYNKGTAATRAFELFAVYQNVKALFSQKFSKTISSVCLKDIS